MSLGEKGLYFGKNTRYRAVQLGRCEVSSLLLDVPSFEV